MFDPALVVGDFDLIQTDPSIPIGVSPILDQNANRVLFVFTNKGTSTLYLANYPSVDGTHYVYSVAPGNVREVYWSKHGLLCSLQWWVFNGGAGGAYGIIDVSFRPRGE
jgi:hypothetical protein